MQFASLFHDGRLWGAVLELLADRTARCVFQTKTDQWAQPARSVYLSGLWIQVRSCDQMEYSAQVSAVWDPLT